MTLDLGGVRFSPRVCSGVAPLDFPVQMLAEPLEPASAAGYQLGPFGTAAKDSRHSYLAKGIKHARSYGPPARRCRVK